jgi:hypothetical protein
MKSSSFNPDPIVDGSNSGKASQQSIEFVPMSSIRNLQVVLLWKNTIIVQKQRDYPTVATGGQTPTLSTDNLPKRLIYTFAPTF